jgi:hypothetical protein
MTVRKLLAAAIPALGALAFSLPAQAAITFCSGAANTCGGQGSTVHLDGLDDGTDNIVNGTVTADNVGVIITDFLPQDITVDVNGGGNGQAWVVATQGPGATHQNPTTFDQLDFALAGGFHFTHIEFDLNPPNGGGPPGQWNVLITGYDINNNPISQLFTNITNNSFFNANADGGDVFTHVAFVTNSPLLGVGHIRIGGVGANGTVPEPATWALMIMGFGGAGAVVRRRRSALA